MSPRDKRPSESAAKGSELTTITAGDRSGSNPGCYVHLGHVGEFVRKRAIAILPNRRRSTPPPYCGSQASTSAGLDSHGKSLLRDQRARKLSHKSRRLLPTSQ